MRNGLGPRRRPYQCVSCRCVQSSQKYALCSQCKYLGALLPIELLVRGSERRELRAPNVNDDHEQCADIALGAFEGHDCSGKKPPRFPRNAALQAHPRRYQVRRFSTAAPSPRLPLPLRSHQRSQVARHLLATGAESDHHWPAKTRPEDHYPPTASDIQRMRREQGGDDRLARQSAA